MEQNSNTNEYPITQSISSNANTSQTVVKNSKRVREYSTDDEETIEDFSEEEDESNDENAENDSIVQSDDDVILKEEGDIPSESSDPEEQRKYVEFLAKEAAKITGQLQVREVAGRCLRVRTNPRIDTLKAEAEAYIAEDHKKKHLSILRKMQKDFTGKPEAVNIVWPKFNKYSPYETVRSEFKRISGLLEIDISDSEDEDEEEEEDEDEDYSVDEESEEESSESDEDESTDNEEDITTSVDDSDEEKESVKE